MVSRLHLRQPQALVESMVLRFPVRASFTAVEVEAGEWAKHKHCNLSPHNTRRLASVRPLDLVMAGPLLALAQFQLSRVPVRFSLLNRS